MSRAILSVSISFLLSGTLGVASAQTSAAFPDTAESPDPAPTTQPAAQPNPATAAPPAPAPRFATGAQSGWGGSSGWDTPASGPTSWGSPTAGWGTSVSPQPDSVEPKSSGGSSTLLVAGSLTLALPYATGIGIALAEGFANKSGWLVLPVGGPWISLASRTNPCDQARDAKEFSADVGECVAEPMVRGLLVLDGVLQATGALLMLLGSGSGSDDDEPPARATQPGVYAMPAQVGSGYGVGVLGRF